MLLRKHILDDAGKRVPLYRTGFWAWRTSREQQLDARVHNGLIARLYGAEAALLRINRRRWTKRLLWSLFLGLIATMVTIELLGLSAGLFVAKIVGVTIGLALILRFWPQRNFPVRYWIEVTRAMLDYRLCPSCGYDLDSVADGQDGRFTCPECGAIWQLYPKANTLERDK